MNTVSYKHDVGVELWSIRDYKAVSFTLSRVSIQIDKDGVTVYYYDGDANLYRAEHCYLSKEELIASL